MKKLVVAVLVFGSFVLYSLGIRHSHKAAATTQLPAAAVKSAPPSPASSTTSNTPVSTAAPAASYKDGTYTGSQADAYYGTVQVSALISGGKITAVNFLQSPNDRPNSVEISQQAIPLLQQEAIQGQTARVQVITGATFTSEAFKQSLDSALAQAKV